MLNRDWGLKRGFTVLEDTAQETVKGVSLNNSNYYGAKPQKCMKITDVAVRKEFLKKMDAVFYVSEKDTWLTSVPRNLNVLIVVQSTMFLFVLRGNKNIKKRLRMFCKLKTFL